MKHQKIVIWSAVFITLVVVVIGVLYLLTPFPNSKNIEITTSIKLELNKIGCIEIPEYYREKYNIQNRIMIQDSIWGINFDYKEYEVPYIKNEYDPNSWIRFNKIKSPTFTKSDIIKLYDQLDELYNYGQLRNRCNYYSFTINFPIQDIKLTVINNTDILSVEISGDLNNLTYKANRYFIVTHPLATVSQVWSEEMYYRNEEKLSLIHPGTKVYYFIDDFEVKQILLR